MQASHALVKQSSKSTLCQSSAGLCLFDAEKCCESSPVLDRVEDPSESEEFGVVADAEHAGTAGPRAARQSIM